MRKSLRFTVACLAALFLLSFSVMAQSTISGTILNSSTKEGVPAVSVSIKGTAIGTYTDDKGMFTITAPKLPVTLVFTSVGYESKEMNITNASSSVNVEMAAVSTLGQEVIVAANRTPQRILESPVTIERMSSANLKAIAAPSYYEALTNLKGVDMHTASLTFRTVTTRGFLSSGNTRMNQLIDGMDNQAPGLNFSVGNIVGLTELDVDNMELLSGASSALYGSGGMNGTLLINSKNPFKYKGLSFTAKTGVMHFNEEQKSPSSYYDINLRWANSYKDKLAFKFTGELIKASDWEAIDYSNTEKSGLSSIVKPGNRRTDPGYNGVNVYGDETSTNILLTSQAIKEGFRSGIQQASGIPNIFAMLDGQIPNGSNFATRNSVYALYGALQPTLQAADPYYWGLRNSWYKNENVSRSGYNERDLVDYGTQGVKFTAALHYKITPGIEASWNTYWGTGTSVYTGADRYSLRNFVMAQHKLEVRHKNWFVRGYTTQENAGDAYQATALGQLMQEAFRPSIVAGSSPPAGWYPLYIQKFFRYKDSLATGPSSDYNAHLYARSFADEGMPLPGTPAYENSKKQISTTPIGQGGSKFLDKSDLWAAEGQMNVSDVFDFSDKVEVIAGVQWKQWVMNSSGTIFADSAGTINISEIGTYAQLRKKLFNDVLTLTGAIRYDKQTNFDGRWTPRVTAVIKVAENNNIRVSYQTAYRFPSNQNQYIDLNTQSAIGILIGCLPEFVSRYGLNTGTYTSNSIADARKTLDPTKLVPSTINTVEPESVASAEIGYKALWGKRFLIDAYAYYSRYKNFFIAYSLGKAASPVAALDPRTTQTYTYYGNNPENVKVYGWGIGLEYLLPRGYVVSGNFFSDKMTEDIQGSQFNAPPYRFNISLRNDNVCKNIGFNIIAKWQDANYYEGTFVVGTLPAFTWVDAQVTYRMPKSKSMFRIGGTNIANNFKRTGYGSPSVGGVYYVSYGYNVF